MIKKELEKRNLPDLFTFLDGSKVKNINDWEKRREEIKNIISNEEYGDFPKRHVPITYKVYLEDDKYFGGKAIYREIFITMHIENDEFVFPIKVVLPKEKKRCPAFLYISFTAQIPNKHMPVEEICDNGFAVVSFGYEDITSDDENLENGLSKYFYNKCKTRNFGKILVWSWAAMHVMDYMQTIEEIDKDNVTIVGLSRLGKTALLTGAFDDRFKCTISNESGQSGAALSRRKLGENIKCIYSRFPFWFCSNYSKYIDNEELQNFDQHFLTSLIAPRGLYISSASQDTWADPKSEFLNCVATSKVYDLYNKKGFIHKDEFPKVDTYLHEGNIGYHIRKGTHGLNRYDWKMFMKFINR